METGLEGTIASSGTYVGAVLETAGMYYQEMILNSFGAALSGPVGMLVLVFGLIIAIGAIASSGRYAMSVWLLIGPVLFLFVLNTREVTWGSAWIFGGEFRNTQAVQSEIEGFLEEKELNSGEPATVSWVYAWYSRIVSKTVREVVRVLNQGREGTDLLHQRRMEFFAAIHSSRVEDKDFLDLLHYVYFLECRPVIEAGRAIRDPALGGQVDHNIARYENALKRLVPINRSVSRYLASLKAWNAQLFELVLQGSPDVDSAVYTFANDAAGVELPANYQQNYVRYQNELMGRSFTCNQIWDFSRVGLLVEAKKIVDNLTMVARDGTRNAVEDGTSLNYQKLIHDVGRMTGINQGAQEVQITNFDNAQFQLGNMESLYRVIATYLFRNEINQDMQSAFLHRFTRRFESREVEAPGAFDIVETDRPVLQKREAKEKSTMMTHAAQLPYYQGLVLYFLGVTFPFFSVMLLIPGRHSGFLMWFGFYLWAKSWDIGFAVVMMLDDVLFSMFEVAHNVNAIDNGLRDADALSQGIEISRDAALAAHIAVELDPTFQMGTYYAIMGTALGSIPLVSAHLVLGGMKAGSGLISQGMSNYSDHYSNAAYAATSGEFSVSNSARASYVMEQMMSKVSGSYQRSGGGGTGLTSSIAHRNYVPEQSALQTNLIPGMSMLDVQKQYGGLSKIKSGNAQIYGTGGSQHLMLSSQFFRGVGDVTGSSTAKAAGKVLGRTSGDFVNTVNQSQQAYNGIFENLTKRGYNSSRANQQNQLVNSIEVPFAAGSEGGDALVQYGRNQFSMMVNWYMHGAGNVAEAAIPDALSSAKAPVESGKRDKVKGFVLAPLAAALGGFMTSGVVEEKKKREEQTAKNFRVGDLNFERILSQPGAEPEESEEEDEE